MCDTIVAVGSATKDQSVIFAKNSDREPNEVHVIEYHPRQKYSKDAKVNTTYITIPQVEETYEVLLLKPFWMWGCEMGANEFGVTIGNEAVWTKMPYRKEGLLGMDIIRLALERSQNAEEALNVIIRLIEEYGQGGRPGYTDSKLTYHNSFIIADPHEAWVLETADNFWIAEKVKGIRTISNTLTIGGEYDKIHPNLIDYAINKGYCRSEDDFNFAKNFIPPLKVEQIGAMGNYRHNFTTKLLKQKEGEITPEFVMKILRKHNSPSIPMINWSPQNANMRSICMHATGPITPSQTVGSLVSHLKDKLQVHWVTGTSSPCISIFKPIFLPGIGYKQEEEKISKTYNEKNLWWKHEKLHRLVLEDYNNRAEVLKKEREQIENKLIKRVKEIAEIYEKKQTKKMKLELQNLTEEAFKENIQKIDEWIKKVRNLKKAPKLNYFYKLYWKKNNKLANIELK